MVGDTVGKPGLNIVCLATHWLKQRLKADLVIVNAENAADGAGLRQREYRRLMEAGVDAVTLGDHIYKKREIIEVLQNEANIVKPANFPANAPGKRWCVVQTAEGIKIAVISVLGRVFMRPVDCPFTALQSVLEEIPGDVILKIVDIHAEATSDKQSIGRYFDGRVTAMLGTHTHVPTADEQIFPGGSGCAGVAAGCRFGWAFGLRWRLIWPSRQPRRNCRRRLRGRWIMLGMCGQYCKNIAVNATAKRSKRENYG